MVAGNLRPKSRLNPVGRDLLGQQQRIGRTGWNRNPVPWVLDLYRGQIVVKSIPYVRLIEHCGRFPRLHASNRDTSHCRDGIIVCELGSQETFPIGWQAAEFCQASGYARALRPSSDGNHRPFVH